MTGTSPTTPGDHQQQERQQQQECQQKAQEEETVRHQSRRHGSDQEEARSLSTDKAVSVDLTGAAPIPSRPSPVTHLYAHSLIPHSPKSSSLADKLPLRSSTPSYESPLRHHRRQPSTPRQVKETLNARSEYTNSEDDGTAIHRINQYIIQQEIGRGSFGAVHRAVDQYGHEYVRSTP